MRRAAAIAAALAVAVGGAVAIAAVFSSRDDATFSAAEGPGRLQADRGARHGGGQSGPTLAPYPPTSGPHLPRLPRADARPLSDHEVIHALELGDVVLVYDDKALERPLRRLATDVAGPYSRDLASTGQAVVLDYAPRGIPGHLAGLAWRRVLPARSTADPALAEFVEFWLGRGRPR